MMTRDTAEQRAKGLPVRPAIAAGPDERPARRDAHLALPAGWAAAIPRSLDPVLALALARRRHYLTGA
jgi:hypothetical protein